jgi:hypothetical protein
MKWPGETTTRAFCAGGTRCASSIISPPATTDGRGEPTAARACVCDGMDGRNATQRGRARKKPAITRPAGGLVVCFLVVAIARLGFALVTVHHYSW